MYDYQLSTAALTAWMLFYQAWSVAYKVGERKLRKFGLTPEQIDILWACRSHPGPLTPTELSRILFRESQTVTGLLARMERQGLVTRVPKRNRRLFVEVQITAKGQELMQPGLEVARAIIERLMSCLSADELEQLQKLLRKLRQKGLEELEIELAPAPSLQPAPD